MKGNGFTLMEIIAVLAIIGIVLSIALPMFNPMSDTLRLKTSAENLANTLESARQYAVTSGADCYVVFPRMTSDAQMNLKAYKIYTSYGGTVGEWEFLPQGVSIGTGSTFLSDTIAGVPFPEDISGSTATLSRIKIKKSGRADLTRTIDLANADATLSCSVRIYSYPASVRVYDIEDTVPAE